MSEHYTGRRINVRGIIYKDGKILAVKHRSKDGSVAPYYAIPGGGLDPHESLEEGLQREIMEELGVKAEIGALVAVQQFPSTRMGYAEELEFLFSITNVDDFDDFDYTQTSHGAIELAVVEYIDPKITKNFYPIFLQTLNYEAIIGGKMPTAVVNNLNEKASE